MAKPTERWYKFTKHFRGGVTVFQIKVPPVRLSKDDWEEICDWLGENTNGGHSAGYTFYWYKLKKGQHPKLDVVNYPSHLVSHLAGYGKPVVTTTMMI